MRRRSEGDLSEFKIFETDEFLKPQTHISMEPPDGIEMPTRGISSHQGANHAHPANTLPAFREAVRAGAHQIEFDIRFTCDGELVIMHDQTVDRTTNGSGDVSRKTLEELKELDAGSWKHPAFAGVRIPTLDEVLKIMPHNVWLNLELKGGYQLGVAVAEKVIEQGRAYQSFIAAKHREAAEGARSVVPNILICNMTRRVDVDLYVSETIENGDTFIQLRSQDGRPTPEQICRLKDAGVKINFYKADVPEELDELYALGIDFPLVNNLHPMMERARQLGIMPQKVMWYE